MTPSRGERLHVVRSPSEAVRASRAEPEVSSTLPTVDTRLVATALAVLCGCALYLANLALRLPAPVYQPELGAWAMHPPEGAIAMRYYGGLLYLAAGGVAGWTLGRLGAVSARLGRGRAAQVLSIAGVAALLLAMAYIAVAELNAAG